MRKFSLSSQIFIGVLLGIIAGLSFGKSVVFLGELGQLLITLIKTVATPLIFLSIVEAILTSEITWAKARRLFFVVTINGACAAGIGIGISNLFTPGRFLDARAMAPLLRGKVPTDLDPNALSFFGVLSSMVPTSVVKPFVDNSVIAVVVLALLLGFALRRLRDHGMPDGRKSDSTLERLIAGALLVVEMILSWVIHLAPIGVFGVISKVVGEYGFSPFKGLGVYTLAALGGMAIQIGVVYGIWVLWVAKIPLRKFWLHTQEAVFYSAGVNSSLATLPLTLKSLDALQISKSSSRLGACVGTNLNNDGILLYEAMAVLFVAQAYGIHLSLTQQLGAAALCVIAAIGVTGVPEAGIISLSLVLAAAGLPVEILPLLLAVDWIVARARSVTNVLADIVVSIGIDAISNDKKSG